MLRVEVDVYRALQAPFMPELLGSHVDERLAVLAIEDLSSATWPPPYPEDVAPLMEAVRQVAAYEPPESVPASWKAMPPVSPNMPSSDRSC